MKTPLIVMRKSLLPICAFSFIKSVLSTNESFQDEKVIIASKKASQLIKIFREKTGTPGICVNVNIGGSNSVNFNYGYSDIENLTKCKHNTLMRIASISKSFTSLIVAQLMDEGLLDIDKDINEYLPDFPKKSFGNKNTEITCRQLLSHRSGLRNYKKEGTLSEYSYPEFLNTKHCDDSTSTRKCFENDDLEYSPGTKFQYTVYGYVLLGSILEKVAQKSAVYCPKDKKASSNVQFLEGMFKTLFHNLGLENTHCEYHNKILINRSRQYLRNCKLKCTLEPSSYVDNSCKWAAGGIVSTCQDLSKMAQNLVDIWLGRNDGIISRKSLEILWTPISGNDINVETLNKWVYGLGWCIKEEKNRLLVGHLGGASGGTSALIINLPKNDSCDNYIIVTILCNMESLSDSIGDLAVGISKLYQN